jgi:copper homeostasis protein
VQACEVMLGRGILDLRVCMANRVLLEICVETVDQAVAAENGGADRIEFCSDLPCGGVTPEPTLMRTVRQRVGIPIHVMIRPRAGDFCYSEREFETMKRDVAVAKEIGLSGVVLGVLDPDGNVDRESTRALVQVAHPLPVTFHRAFDQCPDLTVALETVIQTGATRILTSGGAAGVVDGLVRLASLVKIAGNRIVIMPGSGVRCENVERILRSTGAREIHTSLGASDPTAAGARQTALFETRVRKFKRVLEAENSISAATRVTRLSRKAK